MEYLTNNRTKVIVDGDMVKYGELDPKRFKIGVNYNNGFSYGGYLSSFSGTFSDELIGIETGLEEIIDARIGDLKEAYDLLESKDFDSNNIFEISCAVIDTVNEYFNGFDNANNRLDYYASEDYPEYEDNKISNLKGSGAAKCVERAAVSQNLLKSLGINSVYKTSGILQNDQKDIHSYNLIEFDNKYYIFDTSVPNLVDGKICPLIAEIDKSTFDLLSCPIKDIGISTTVSHYNPYRDVDVTITYDSGRNNRVEFDAIKSISKTR